jgi:hypothetical protein
MARSMSWMVLTADVGRRKSPINHGPCSNLLLDGVNVIQEFIKVADSLEFTVLALCQK